MRILKALFAVVLSASFLVACGGGDVLDTLTGGSNGGGDLIAAYDKIECGMSYDQVKSIIGSDAKTTSQVSGSSGFSYISYVWQTGSGYSNDIVTLGVGTSNNIVASKTVQSKEDNRLHGCGGK